MSLAYIALGSNLGDRAAHLLAARDALAKLPNSSIVRCSHVYETEPLGPSPQNCYLNAAIELRTDLAPVDLMAYLLGIESAAGRIRRGKWGPRTLDLDLLLYDDRVIDSPSLTVPHPQLHLRPFVLQPLCDINEKLMHPVMHQSVRQLLDALNAPELRRYEIHAWPERPT